MFIDSFLLFAGWNFRTNSTVEQESNLPPLTSPCCPLSLSKMGYSDCNPQHFEPDTVAYRDLWALDNDPSFVEKKTWIIAQHCKTWSRSELHRYTNVTALFAHIRWFRCRIISCGHSKIVKNVLLLYLSSEIWFGIAPSYAFTVIYFQSAITIFQCTVLYATLKCTFACFS